MNTLDQKRAEFGPKFIAQVIRILDEKTLIINASYETDTKVQVYEYLGELKDLDGKVLGTLEYIKADLEVVQCEAGYSICKTIPEKTTIQGLALSPLLDTFSGPRPTFPVDKNDLQPLKPMDKFVRVGDPVKHS